MIKFLSVEDESADGIPWRLVEILVNRRFAKQWFITDAMNIGRLSITEEETKSQALKRKNKLLPLRKYLG